MKATYAMLAVSTLLIVTGFLMPPAGVIDGSVLTGSGVLLAYAVVLRIPDILNAVREGRSIRVQKGDFKAEVNVPEKSGESD